MSVKFESLDAVYRACRIGEFCNGDKRIIAISISRMARTIVASHGEKLRDAIGMVATVFMRDADPITDKTEFVVVDDTESEYPNGLPRAGM